MTKNVNTIASEEFDNKMQETAMFITGRLETGHACAHTLQKVSRLIPGQTTVMASATNVFR